MQLPLSYLDSAAIEEVPIDLWRELLEATGWPQSLEAKRSSFGHEDVFLALSGDNLSDDLLQALEALHALGTEKGRDAIVAAMGEGRVPIQTLSENASEPEFALRLFLGQRTNASLADVFARAQTQVQEAGEQRRYNEFMGQRAQSIHKLDMAKEKLHQEVLRFCQKSDLGEHVQVRAFDDDGTVVFSILRSHRTKKPLAVVPGRSARATIEFRPVHGDLLRYESSLGRLRIAARSAPMVEFYREAAGKALFGDQSFFDGAPICNLDVLRDHGRLAFDNHGVFGVGRIWMTECLWERGDRNLLQIRSADCFRSIEELRLPLKEGTLLQAKLKVEVIAKSTRPVTVNIRVPSRIEISQKVHEKLMERVLDAIGIRNSAPLSPTDDLWSLYPWRHPIAVWRTLFGADTDALVQAGALKPIQLGSVPHPEHPDAGRVLQAHETPAGALYGVSDAPEVPSRALSATDLDGLELVPERFGDYLRNELQITSAGHWDGQGLLELGTIPIGTQSLYVAYALRQPTNGIGDRLRIRANGAHPVLLVPAKNPGDSELARVELEAAVPRPRDVVRSAIGVCGLSEQVLAIHFAPNGARLVVDTLFNKVWVDGVEVSGLVPDAHGFKFIELMARGPGRVCTEEISRKLSEARKDGNTPARQAKGVAKKAIAESMALAGREPVEDPFPSDGTGFYRCILPAYVR